MVYDFFIHGTPYIEYAEYLNPDNQDAIDAALKKRKEGKESLSAEEQHWCDVADHYDDNKKEVKDFLKNKGDYKDSYKAEYEKFIDENNEDYKIDDAVWKSQEKDMDDDHYVNPDNYGDIIEDLEKLAPKIRAQAKDVVAAKNALQEALDAKDDKGNYKVDEALRTNIGNSMKKIDEVVSDKVVNTLCDMADYESPNKGENDNYKKRIDYVS